MIEVGSLIFETGCHSCGYAYSMITVARELQTCVVQRNTDAKLRDQGVPLE